MDQHLLGGFELKVGWEVWGAAEAQTRVRSTVADQWQKRSECILCYILKSRRSSQNGQTSDWRSTRGLAILREARILMAAWAFPGFFALGVALSHLGESARIQRVEPKIAV